MPPIYPFTAIVGQERMKRALVLNAVDPRIGGVLIRGERGTAKSTAARALAALLPSVAVVSDCRFGCDPDRPTTWCTECRERSARGDLLPVELRTTAFVNLPVSATEDRVVGTLDIEKAIQKGERHFEPGVLAAANRGLLYIDEVNLLDDHVVDLLLDFGRHGDEHRRARRDLLRSPGALHPGGHDEPGRRRPAPAAARPLCSVGGDPRNPGRARTRADHGAQPGFRRRPQRTSASSGCPRSRNFPTRSSMARTLVDQVNYTRRDLLSIAA